MKVQKPKLLDVVAVLHDIEDANLLRGQVGTVVETFDDEYEVEFVDDNGKTIAIKTLREDEIIVLHYNFAAVA